ncbi:enoyl-CoA hydratase-related protein [Duganella qianjiadongensis]|uniref:Enoyl-CoA hydratase/isomerase family protein n=1 Tax=Duganella qianjiadongensis TaxID=2692176 RepID=A0ABW9VJP9_9BURK|nr:enoyl-CoA hydratase-related protein [Duganella qianjiadongensis]MYM39814.1 hypothetical protein [Duganella qianjiadongensis]
MISIVQQTQRIIVTLDTASIHPLNSAWQQALRALLEQLEKQTENATQSGIVQLSFLPDAPERRYPQAHALSRDQAPACMQQLASYHALLRRLERLPVPAVAAIQGNIGEHGWAVALACHHRYSLATASIRLRPALRNVAPCGGLLVRTARLLGLQNTLAVLLDGFELDSNKALELGLIQAIAADAAQLDQLLQQSASMPRPPRQPWDEKHPTLPGGAADSPANLAFLQLAPARLRARPEGATASASAILCALAEGCLVDFDTAALLESRYFCQSAIALAP